MKRFYCRRFLFGKGAIALVVVLFGCHALQGQVAQTHNNADWNSAFPSTPVSTESYITKAGFSSSAMDTVGVAYTSTIRANDNGGTNTFAGESLTVAGNTRLLLKQNPGDTASANLILDNQSNTVLATGNNTGTVSLAGTIDVSDDADAFVGMNNTGAATLAVGSTVTGTGTLNLGIGGDTSGETLSLTGDLSGFQGTIEFYTPGTFSISGPSLTQTTLDFSDENATFLLKNALYVGNLTVGSTAISKGSYSAAQLNQLSGTSIFVGSANVGVQIQPPTPLQVTDGRITASVGSSGAYSVASSVTGWTFQGQLPNAPSQIATSTGTDSIGAYQQLSFSWLDASSRQMTGFINLYTNQDTVLFSDTLVAAGTSAPASFPDFTSMPQGLSFYSYDSTASFAPPIYSLQNASAPWVFFDATPHAAIISPASHFLPAQMIGDGKTEIGSGFNNTVTGTTVPAGFTQTTLLTLTSGINHAFDLWGTAMTNLHGKTRPAYDADVLLRYYGYWTDNGATYYYNYNNASTNPSSTANYETTLESVVSNFTQAKIPVHYMQLDSWWYDKSAYSYSNSYGSSPDAPGHSNLPNQPWNLFGGQLLWAGDTNLFPSGVHAFSQALGSAASSSSAMPLVCHARWIDPNPAHGGTYAANPTYYGVTGICCTSPNYWNSLASYASSNNISVYEQDWIQNIIQNSPALTNTVGTGDTFFGNMSSSFASAGVNIQYCIPTPAAFMQGSEYNNVTTTRAAYDRFGSNQYHSFIFASRLAKSMGMWPWSDLFYSNETANLLLSNLSAGPVGTGDAIGNESASSLAQTLRGDGVIVKPDGPLIPTDGTYLAESKSAGTPYVASTSSQNGIQTTYAVAIPESSTSSQNFTLSSSDLGVSGPAYYYDYFAGTGTAVAAGGSYNGTINSSLGLSYFVIAPVGPSGIAFLGDQAQFVADGRKRIASVADQSGQLTANVLFAPTESQITLHGYSSVMPVVTVPAAQGQASAVSYNSNSGHFTVQITANVNAPLNSDLDPARAVAVTFTTASSLVSAVSQQVHGSAGTFSLPLPLTGPVAIEPREGSPQKTYTIVATFSGPITGLNATLGLQAGQAGNPRGSIQSVTTSGSTATIVLSEVEDGQRLNLHVSGVQPGNTSGDIPINILWGDVNGDGTVNTLDFLKVKSESQALLNASTFIYDVNVDGSVNIQDVLVTKSLSQTYLP